MLAGGGAVCKWREAGPDSPNLRGTPGIKGGGISATPHVTLCSTTLRDWAGLVTRPTINLASARWEVLTQVHFADPGMALQEIWRQRLEEAERKYEDAATELQSALSRNSGVVEARQQKMAARAEYLRLLRIFSDLVLRGKVPEVDGSPQPEN